MIKSSFVKAKVESHLKKQAETVLHELGITPTQAVTMLYKQIAQENEWPIELKIPNAETIQTFKETDTNIGLVKCTSVDEMFKILRI